MSGAGETFFTSIGCMDGRVQDPIAEFGRRKFGVRYADTITEAGLVGQLGKDNVDPALVEAIKKKLLISIEKHHSKGVIVHGHQDCAASNAVDDEKHKEDILKTAEIIKSFVPQGTEVVPVFVVKELWKVVPLR
ncbi:MAG: hypothetical protein HY426_00430 [Candidatus Levybacteria bacterium]|nr:hypothetical protein [Candidatus Levybacteria bacterium]